jgi:hypothetical protein
MYFTPRLQKRHCVGLGIPVNPLFFLFVFLLSFVLNIAPFLSDYGSGLRRDEFCFLNHKFLKRYIVLLAVIQISLLIRRGRLRLR